VVSTKHVPVKLRFGTISAMGYIYLIQIGRFKNAYENRVFDFNKLYNTKILSSMDPALTAVLKDDIGVYKFGKTKNLDKRFIKHCKVYGSLSDCINLHLIKAKVVSDDELTLEENKVKSYLLDKNVFFIEKSYDKKITYKELVLIKDEDLKDCIELCFKFN